jgi:hypothetical protein
MDLIGSAFDWVSGMTKAVLPEGRWRTFWRMV